MSAPVENFEFFVSNIEDAVIAALEGKAGGYARDIALYSGELDSAAQLRDALVALEARFPLFLVTYTEGKSERQTQLAPGIDAPWSVRHNCTFLVICVDDNARGETERRRGAYGMASDALAALENRQFVYVEEEQDIRIVLTPGEFISTGIEHIASYSDVTAYAVPFETYFYYLTPDWRAAESPVEQIVFEVNPLNSPRRGTGLPGVSVSIEE